MRSDRRGAQPLPDEHHQGQACGDHHADDDQVGHVGQFKLSFCACSARRSLMLRMRSIRIALALLVSATSTSAVVASWV